jgi:O-antigen ligase
MTGRRSIFYSPVSIVTGAFVAWFTSYSYLYWYSHGGPKPLYSYLILLAFTLLWIVRSSRIPGWNYVGIRYFLIWLYAYLVCGIFSFFGSTKSDVALQKLINLAEMVLLAGAFVLLMSDKNRLRVVQFVFLSVSLFSVLMNLVDFLNPFFSKDPGRAAGLYVNSNISGTFIVLSMVAGITVLPRRLRLPYIAICGLGVLLTFSRSSWMVWAVSVFSLGIMGFFGAPKKHAGLTLIAVLLGAAGAGLLFSGQIGSYVENSSVSQYLTPNTSARLGIGQSVLSGQAASVRQQMIGASLGEFEKAPIFGHGIGYSAEWEHSVGPHNMYLLFMVEGGLTGLLLYVLLMCLLVSYGFGIGKIIGIQLILSSLFTHNFLEQPAFVIMFAFVIAHGYVRSMSPKINYQFAQ